MVKWEYYDLVTIKFGGRQRAFKFIMDGHYLKDGVKTTDEPTDFFDHIQELGDKGWELVIHHVVQREGEIERNRYIFKREIKNE